MEVSESRKITVPMPAELRAFVERAAQREDRSMAAQVRHMLAEAARREPEGRAA